MTRTGSNCTSVLLIAQQPNMAQAVRQLVSRTNGQITISAEPNPGPHCQAILFCGDQPDKQLGWSGIPVILLSETSETPEHAYRIPEGAADCLFLDELSPQQLVRSIHYAVERAEMTQRLKQTKARFELAIRGANDGLWDWDLVRNTVFWSERWAEIMGIPQEQLASDPETWLSRIEPDDRTEVQSRLKEHLSGLSAHFEAEFRVIRANGEKRWVLARGLAIREDGAKPSRIAGSLTDIHHRKIVERQAAFKALHDQLTGLPNRTLLLDRLNRSFARSKRHNNVFFALLFIDLDRFKVVNDSLGHQAGDQLLQQVGQRLQACVREGDTVARLSGDEFTILLDDLRNNSDALAVADRVITTLSEPMFIDNHELYTNASIGIAFSNPSYEKPGEILRDADAAMYRAKEAGRGRHMVYGPGMHAQTVAILKMESQLRKAIHGNELALVYQPIIELPSQRLSGFEAFVRWPQPDADWMTPAEFLPLAEETGLILPLGNWVLEEAARTVTQWSKQGLISDQFWLNINLSARQFRQPELTESISDLLHRWPVLKHRLRLEVTESALMTRKHDQAIVLTQLKELGTIVQIDDFGTGYSSLSNLSGLPVSALKIDRSFIRRMGEDVKNKQIVRAIVTLANSLGISVAAEGIETEEQLKFMADLGCNEAQGYFFSKPVSAKEAKKLFHQSPSP